VYDKNEMVKELAEFFHFPEDETLHYLENGDRYYMEEWNRLFGPHPPKGDEEIKDFYKKSMFAAFDMAKWHSDDKKMLFDGKQMTKYEIYSFEVLHFLKNAPKMKILDYGGGIGSLDIRISEMGHDITSYDIGERVQEFARFRAEKHGATVRFLREIPDEKFDCVICHDVLEHCNDLEYEIKQISNLLKHDGHLFLRVTFPLNPQDNRSNPSHLKKYMGMNIFSLYEMLSKVGIFPLGSYTHFLKN